MKFLKTSIDGCFIVEPTVFFDKRGSFVKSFNQEVFFEQNLIPKFKEHYYSISHKNVGRGMHFQMPPHDHDKLIYVSSGAALDVILDLRKNSKTYRQCFTMEIEAVNKIQLYIPRGCAHGFVSLSDNTCMHYLQTTVYNPESDMGILMQSLNIPIDPKCLIFSDRDLSFPTLDAFDSPF